MTRLSDLTFTDEPRSAAARQRMQETAAGLLSYVPFFASLFYDRMKVRWVPADTREMPTLGTDGTNIIINEGWWEKHNIHERVFGLCHEIMHAAWDDCHRSRFYHTQGTLRGHPFDFTLANIAQDFRINAMLVTADIGKMPQGCVHDTAISDGTETFEDIYEKLMKNAKVVKQQATGGKGGKPCGDGDGDSEGDGPAGGALGHGQSAGFDYHFPPTTSQSPAEAAQRKAEWGQAINAAKAAAKAVGNMPGALEALVDELLDVQIPWTDQLKRFMRRHTRGVGARTWKTLNKRKLVFHPQLVLPGRAGFGAENIVCVFDTSGSMGEREFKQVISEAASILTDVRPRTLWVIQGDAEVGDVKRLPEGAGVRELMYRKGFGGTDFRPPFKRIEELGIRPEVLVYFTDLYGPFPDEAPKYPVIWCAVSDETAPWGETIHVKFSG